MGERNVWEGGGLEIRAGEDIGDVTVVMTDQVGDKITLAEGEKKVQDIRVK